LEVESAHHKACLLKRKEPAHYKTSGYIG